MATSASVQSECHSSSDSYTSGEDTSKEERDLINFVLEDQTSRTTRNHTLNPETLNSAHYQEPRMRLSSLSTGYLPKRSNIPPFVFPSTSNILPPQISILPHRHTLPPTYRAPTRDELMYLNSNFKNTTQLSPLLLDTNPPPTNSAINTTTHTSLTSLSLIPSTSLTDQGRAGLSMAQDPPQLVHTSARSPSPH